MKHFPWKHTLVLGAVLIGLSSCDKPDDDDTGSTYPSDNISVSETQNVYVLQITSATCGTCIPTQEALAVLKARHPGRIIPMSLHVGDTLYSPVHDILYATVNDDSGNPYKLFVNSVHAPDQAYAYDYVNGIVTSQVPPVVGVGHTTRQNDTAWLVYPKVKFFDNTQGEYYIQSYVLMSDVVARDYGGGLNLIQVSSDSRVSTGAGGSPTTWNANGGEVEPGTFLYGPGDVYHHLDVPGYQGIDDSLIYGIPLEDVNPIGSNYFAGDVFGNQYTPIQIAIRKPVFNMPQAIEAKLKVVTIVWRRYEGSPDVYAYENGYYSDM